MDSFLFGRAVDSSLDQHGERQVQALAQAFAGWSSLLVHASPRRRAQQTAAAIAAAAGVAVRTAAQLDEVDFGRWAGASFAALANDQEWRRWNDERSSACTPAGDSMRAVQTRVIGHLRDLHEAYPERTVALVTHGEVIRAALMYCLGAGLDDYVRFEIRPASCTTISVNGDDAQVHGANEIAPSLARPILAAEGSGTQPIRIPGTVASTGALSRAAQENWQGGEL